MRFGGPVVPLVSIRTATPGRRVTAAVAGRRQLRFGVEGRDRDHRRRRLPATTRFARSSVPPMTTGRSSAAMSAVVRSSPRDGLMTTTVPPAEKHAEERRDVSGPVAQQHPDLPPVADRAPRSAGPASRDLPPGGPVSRRTRSRARRVRDRVRRRCAGAADDRPSADPWLGLRRARPAPPVRPVPSGFPSLV